MNKTKYLFFSLILTITLFSCKSLNRSTRADRVTAFENLPEQQRPLSYFNIYRGNSHTHTIFTWTHGEHRKELITRLDKPTPFHPDWNVPPGVDWKDDKTINLDPQYYINLQGLPDNHFELAIANGYDFFAITDHTQEPPFQPVSPDNRAWQATLKAAEKYDAYPDFVAIAGFEYSRNTDADGGNGHINVLNSAEYINADHGQRGPAPGWPEANWSIPEFFEWVKSGPKPQGEGDVVVGFNHPNVNQYGDWDNIDPDIIEKISNFELHTNYNKIRWQAYIRALNKGWKVSPIGVHDHHGYSAILNPAKFPPTLVLAPELTKEDILKAMRARRTFASWIEGVELRYAVNGYIMGSTLKNTGSYSFHIEIKTRTDRPEERVRRIQILRNHREGKDDVEIAAEYSFAGSRNEITWDIVLEDPDVKYYLLRIYHSMDITEDGNYKSHGSTVSAPVWIERQRSVQSLLPSLSLYKTTSYELHRQEY